MNFDDKIPNAPSHWNNDRRHFYKYLSASTARIVLRNRTLRWSTPSQLNDPFDMQFDLSVTCDRDELGEATIDNYWNFYDGAREISATNIPGNLVGLLRTANPDLRKEDLVEILGPAIDKSYTIAMESIPRTLDETGLHTSKTKILALTMRPDNNLMWTHYANGHTGIVLRFRSIPERDSPYGMAKPMNYVDATPPFFETRDIVNIVSGVANTDAQRLMDKIVYTKSNDYEYEQRVAHT